MTTDVDQSRLAINPDSELIVDCDTVGQQEYPLLMIDNVYQDPHYVRQIALELQYCRNLSGRNPGQVATTANAT